MHALSASEGSGRAGSVGARWDHCEMNPIERASGPRAVLDALQDEGMWKICSDGPTCYYLDLDLRAVVRVRGDGSGRFAFDNTWCRLIDVASWDPASESLEQGVIRVGGRPRYTFDPDPTWPSEEWRLQRIVTAIEGVPPDEATRLRARFHPSADVAGR